jgi:hypothetical protein
MADEPHDTAAADLYAVLDTPDMRAPRKGGRGYARANLGRVAEPEAPVDLDLVDYLDARAAELRAFASLRRIIGPLPPPPTSGADTYTWARHAVPEGEQTVLDAIEWRHQAEHRLRLDDTDQAMIRQQPCPGCGCWGLVWDRYAETVRCVNRRCTDDDGVPVAWTLQQVAVHAIRRATRRRTATS